MSNHGNLDLFTDKMVKSIQRSTNVGSLAKVTEVNAKTGKVNVQPLALTYSGKKRAMLIDVWVSRTVRDIIKVDDVAIMLFLDRNSDNFDGSNKEYIIPNERTHSVNDAVVIGLI